jgi:transposase
MQGKKKFTPKLFVNFRLDEQVPDTNFYKILKKHLNLDFIYAETKSVYSHTGRPGIDPVVFFKMLLVGYLENIANDRALERLFQLRLDLLFFIDHDIGEAVPDHSTICKTRKRIPKHVFDKVFNHILKLCIDAGLVEGKTQSIDAAYINANASLDRLEERKLVDRDPDDFIREVFDQDLPDNYSIDDKVARIEKKQRDLIRYAENRKKKYDQLFGPAQKKKRRTFSNATHMSTTDPDARIAKKSGKPRMLCYSSSMSTDIKNNVITNISAEFSSRRDSQVLIKATKQTMARLKENNIDLKTVLADAGYSSGENYALLEQMNIEAFIPLHGTYESHRGAFKYDGRRNAFICPNGQILKPAYIKNTNGRKQVAYTSSKKKCDKCALRENCVNKRGFKRIMSTIYKKEYERMKKRLKTKKGKRSYALRMMTVEPVFGSLQQYYGLRHINVRGKVGADKVMLMAACAFNLKKWVKSIIKESNIQLNILFAIITELLNRHNKEKLYFVFLNT